MKGEDVDSLDDIIIRLDYTQNCHAEIPLDQLIEQTHSDDMFDYFANALDKPGYIHTDEFINNVGKLVDKLDKYNLELECDEDYPEYDD